MQQHIGMAMVFARPMHDLEIKLLKPSDPLATTPSGSLKFLSQSKTGVISHRFEVSSPLRAIPCWQYSSTVG